MSEGSEPGAPSPWDPPSGPSGQGAGGQPPPPPGWQPGPARGYGPGPQPPGQPPGWQPGPMPAAYGQPYPPVDYFPPQAAYGGGGQGSNGMAVASMVLGILGLVFAWFPLLPLVLAVMALIFGFLAKGQIRERRQGGAGMATAGLALGWITVGIQVFFFVVLTVLGAAIRAG